MRAVGSSVAYWRAWLAVVPPRRALTTLLGRVMRSRGPRAIEPVSVADAALAAAALARMPRVLPVAPRTARALYRLLLPGAAEASRTRALDVMRGEFDLYGRRHALGLRPDWHRDPISGRRFDSRLPSRQIDLDGAPNAGDPRATWELARGAHLVDLGVGATLHPDLATPARRAALTLLSSFLDDNPCGVGIHWTSALEASVRSIHWIVAIELLGGIRALRDEERADGNALQRPSPPPAIDLRVGLALLEHGRFIATNLDDQDAVPGNHLLGDLVGLLAIGVALGTLPEAAAWRTRALARLAPEIARQVGGDGASFEGSTAYHRFVVELLLAADLFASAAGLDAGLESVLARMGSYVAGYLCPDGAEPGFGDGDDGRCLPFAPRAPRTHDYLLAVTAMRTGDARLKPPGARYAEEAIWLGGGAGYRRWRALAPTNESTRAASRSFPDGGVHVLRTDSGTYVALRAGGHGQDGVGGHSHNDQLSFVVYLDGAPLVVDPGTHGYLDDPLWRDRFRGTGAHATVVIDGQEQSPIHDGRPFALLDGAHGSLREHADDGDRACLVAEHRGYRRLPARVLHRREVVLDRRRSAVLVVDTLTGRGSCAAVMSLPLDASIAVIPADARAVAAITRAVAGAEWANGLRADRAWVAPRDGRPWIAIVPLGTTPRADAAVGWCSPGYARRQTSTVLRLAAAGPLPLCFRVAMFPVPEVDR